MTLAIDQEDVAEFEVSTEAGSIGCIHLGHNKYHEWIQIDIGNRCIRVILTTEGKVDAIMATDTNHMIHYLR